MLLLVLGVTCVTSVMAAIPPWRPYCPQQWNFPNACPFGNMTVSLFSKTLTPRDCNSNVEIGEFKNPPVIQLDSTNRTDAFTMVMMDTGPDGRGPNQLEWMLTNVTIDSLRNYHSLPQKYVLYNYRLKPLLGANERTLIQILVFRHHNVLRVSFGDLWTTQVRGFSLSTLISNTNHTLRLCGPVAGAQYWLYNATAPARPAMPPYHPNAPPAPPQGAPQPQWVIPVIPVAPGQQTIQPQAPGVPSAPVAPPQNHPQPQYPNTKFPKKSGAAVMQPMHLLFVPVTILAIKWL